MQKVKEKNNWKGETIVEIEVERLKAFRNHPFQVRDDDDLEKLKESIKMYGILTPLLVRPIKDGTYEIISGHRRKRAAALLGYRKVPVLIQPMSYEDAVVKMVDTNLHREHISFSEKAFAYRMKNEAMKQEVGRKKGQSGQQKKGKKTIELIGEEFGDSPKQVQRYIAVRPLGMDTYEMISGHRRMHAAKLAGLEKIPTIIRELTDDEAVICMVDANVQREELLPSEKAFALQIKLLGIKQKIQKFTNQTSRIPKNKPLEVYFSNPNNNKYNNTYKNNTESNLIPSMAQESEDDTIRCDEMEQYYILAETVKQNIDYDVLLQSYPNEGQLVQGIYELIVETVAYIGKKLVVASNELPAELVKNRLMKLNFMHIQYVISSMKKNTTEIKNIKKYLLAALYNAPATMQGYYQAEVNHAMPQYAKRN